MSMGLWFASSGSVPGLTSQQHGPLFHGSRSIYCYSLGILHHIGVFLLVSLFYLTVRYFCIFLIVKLSVGTFIVSIVLSLYFWPL